MSYVTIVGNGFHGIIAFDNAEEAFRFYFEQCKDDRHTLITHDEKAYDNSAVVLRKGMNQ